jgi:N-acetylglucosaminyl-diphospho-decaprenol L-rhamnosyltransferase
VRASSADGPSVSLVVVNYNTTELASHLLRISKGGADQIVVVDNSPAPGIGELEIEHPAATVVRPGSNLGYGRAANLGATRCTNDVVVIANADVEITGDDLRRLATHVGRGVGLAAPRFLTPDGWLIRSAHRREPGWLITLFEQCGPFAAILKRLAPQWHPTLESEGAHSSDHDVLHVLGALMAVDRRAFEEVGGFDERFFLYREETDLCRRLRSAGFAIRHVGSVTAIHVGDASSEPGSVQVSARPFAVASHYRYIRKHRGPVTAAAAWVSGLVGASLWLVAGHDRASARASVRSHLRVLARTLSAGWR